MSYPVPRGRIPDDVRAACKKTYLEFYEEVKQTIPKEDLLEMHVSEGWSKLCTFLELDEASCPSVPFPKAHNSLDVHLLRSIGLFICYTYPFLFVLLIFGTMKTVLTLLRAFRRQWTPSRLTSSKLKTKLKTN